MTSMDRWDFAALAVGDMILVLFGPRPVRAIVVAVSRYPNDVKPDCVRVRIPGLDIYDIHRDRCLELVAHCLV